MLEHLGTNLNTAAGMKLPIPYVERALVNDGEIEIRLCLYMALEEEQEAEQVTDALSGVRFYINQVFDNPVSISGSASTTYTDTEYSGSTTTRFVDMVDYNSGIMNYLVNLTDSHKLIDTFAVDSTEYYNMAGHKNFSNLTFDDFRFAGAEHIGTAKVLKFVADVVATAQVLETSIGDIDLTSDFYLIAKNLNLNMSLICFSSLLDLSGFNTPSGNEFVEAARSDNSMLNFYNSFFSQPSYEEVFKDGILIKTPTTVYTTNNGDIFNGDVMQTIDGTFHGLEISVPPAREKIIRRFMDMPDVIRPTIMGPGTDGFQEALNGFKYIVSVYGSTEELLPRLDVFRKSYIDKSTLTPAGKWYQLFNKTLMTTNRLISQELRVRPELVITPVIVDNRSFEEDSYVAPADLGYDMETDYIYADAESIMMSRIGHFDTAVYGATVQPDEFENEYTLMENGFFFFDYEKALKTQSVISKIFNSDKLENYFGKDALNKYFKLKSVAMARYTSTADIVFSKATYYDESLEISYPKFEYTYYLNSDGMTNTAESEFDYYDNTIYPELMLRNLDLVRNDSFEDYRLMAFQFQDIMTSDGVYGSSARDTDTIGFTIHCTDYTKELYDIISGSFDDYLTGSFQEYFDAAEQFCSYNNIDNFFNDFFASSFEEKYSAAPESAPWIMAPAIYNIHKDLINNEFDGDSQSITEASIVISNQISPRTGNLSSLQTFKDNFESLREFYNSLDLSMFSFEEELIFGTIALPVKELGPPDFLNLTTDLSAAGSDEADAQWLVAVNSIWSRIKQDIRDLFGEMYGTDASDPESGVNMYDAIYDQSGDTLEAMEIVQNLEDSGAFEGLTNTEIADKVTASLGAAGIGTALTAAWSTTLLSYGVGAAGFAGAFGPVGWIAAGIILALTIAVAFWAQATQDKREDFRRDIEDILLEALTELAVSAQEINDSITVAMRATTYPTDFKDIVQESYDSKPVLVYAAYQVLVVAYEKINPEYGEDVLNSSNTGIIPIDTSAIETMSEFIASRAHQRAENIAATEAAMAAAAEEEETE